MPTTRHPRATPWLDALSLLCLAAGATVLAVAYTGFGRVAAGWAPEGVLLGAGARYDHDVRLTMIGAALAVAGLAIGIAATVRTRRIRRAALLGARATR